MSQKGTQSAFEVSGTFPRWHRLHRVVGVRGTINRFYRFGMPGNGVVDG